jgi:hypothetical protein
MIDLDKFRERLERGALLTEREVEHLSTAVIAVLMQEPNVV